MDIDVRKKDVVASVLKGYLSGLPVLGPIVAEMIDDLIPNQRIDRITSLLKALEAKIDPEEKAKVKARMLEEKSIDLMEDGFLQAARALSEERIEHIASLLKNGLTDEDLEQNAYKRLLFILSEINDPEVLLLKFYTELTTIGRAEEFRGKHPGILTAYLSVGRSQKEVDEHAICEAYTTSLIRLGLIKPNFLLSMSQGELPEFDEDTGMMKSSDYYITDLGKLLLRSIDQGEED